MNAKGKKRLLKMADYLESINPRGFNLETYVSFNEYDDNYNPTVACGMKFEEVLKEINKGNKKFNCGTTACAIGNMPLVFPRNFEYRYGDTIVSKNKIDELSGCHLSNFDAAEDWFSLTKEESKYLFMPNSYPESHRSAKYVASRIRSVVKNGFPKKIYEMVDSQW